MPAGFAGLGRAGIVERVGLVERAGLVGPAGLEVTVESEDARSVASAVIASLTT